MPILWMMLDDQTRIDLINWQFKNYSEKLDYPGEHYDTTVEPAIEQPEEIEKLMVQTRKSWKDN